MHDANIILPTSKLSKELEINLKQTHTEPSNVNQDTSETRERTKGKHKTLI
jgi:hypothetical protein